MGHRCLIIGASGQLGRALCAALRHNHQVIEAVRRDVRPGQLRLDLSDAKRAAAALRSVQPDWIVIAGAFCGVDAAERQSTMCRQVNVEGPRAIAEYAQSRGGVVVYYSTDQVFDGSQERYRETDAAHPLNVYARTKVQGEAAIRAALPERHLIIRTAWLYGPDRARRNFVLRLIDELGAGRCMAVPADQWGSPTCTDDLALATRQLLEQGLYGTFHATGPEFVDRAAFAQRVCACFGLDGSRVMATPTRQLGQAARRPLRARLDCHKLQAAGIGPFKNIEAGLRALWSSERALPAPSTG